MISADQEVKELIILKSGSCKLYGFVPTPEGDVHKVHVVKLPEQSWYGDFQILLQM